MGLPFIKMHGCGNDYVFVEGFTHDVPADPGMLARQVSCRHTGIGSDGLVMMQPPADSDADVWMRMFNADGTEGSMCGNALRCVAMWCFLTGRCEFECRIQIGGRVVSCRIAAVEQHGHSATVSVCLGEAIVSADVTPLNGLALFDMPVAVRKVSVGNPHAVVFVPDVDQIPLAEIGPQLECHPEFPDRTNVEFVQVLASDRLRVRVWERGSGITLACGSGACASLAAAITEGLVNAEQPTAIQMPGGELLVQRDPQGQYWLTGPAVETFHGVWYS
ncbi:MAG: diaminopimelate epimerase [Planctomycetaceae bacterium]|nr:diaminopimelate epimerase [Planctomycetaceae bacterium]MCA9066633.1 diaminopimelate epimerase [Planctomycetaceae bacterium]